MVRRLMTQGHECVVFDVNADAVQAEFYRYGMNLPEISEVGRRGSVISSWLLDLTAGALLHDPDLAAYGGHVSDSGEGRRTIEAAIDEGVPAQVLSAALSTTSRAC